MRGRPARARCRGRRRTALGAFAQDGDEGPGDPGAVDAGDGGKGGDDCARRAAVEADLRRQISTASGVPPDPACRSAPDYVGQGLRRRGAGRPAEHAVECYEQHDARDLPVE